MDCGEEDGDGQLYQDPCVKEETKVHRGRLQPGPHLHLGQGDRHGLPLWEPRVHVPQQARGRPELARAKTQGGFFFHNRCHYNSVLFTTLQKLSELLNWVIFRITTRSTTCVRNVHTTSRSSTTGWPPIPLMITTLQNLARWSLSARMSIGKLFNEKDSQFFISSVRSSSVYTCLLHTRTHFSKNFKFGIGAAYIYIAVWWVEPQYIIEIKVVPKMWLINVSSNIDKCWHTVKSINVGSPLLWRFPKSLNPYNVKPFLTDISVMVAQIQKIKKTRCIFFFEFCFWEYPPHPVNWSPTDSTGPQTPFFTDILVSVAQINKMHFFPILLLGGPSPPSWLVPNPFNWS